MTTPKTKEDVVRAAGRLFAERGYHGTSMRDLGQELGILGSSLYSHIDGKDQLLVEVIRRGAAMFQALVDEVMASEGTASERLRALVDGHVQIITEHLDEAATFLNESRFLPVEDRAGVIALRDRYQRAFRDLIEEGLRSGEFRAVEDAAMASTFVLSVLNALVRWYRPSGPMDPDEIASRMYEFVLEGLT